MPARTLTLTPASKNGTAARAIQVVLYARVSSKDQEKEGFSIPAQLRLLRDYATNRGLVIAQEFTDVETAKASGRTNFNEMLLYLKKHQTVCRTILVEKTDRLYRNIKDYATIDEFDVAVHFVKENEIISRSSRSNEQFVHGIKVLMARNYSQNLGEETVKGMTEKACAGIYPSCAPVGYRNADGPDGKRVIVSDLDAAPMITELFGRFATGRYSLRALVKEANGEGLQLRGRKLYSSVVHQILRKRLYSGDFDWDGRTYTGSHEPLVTRECWQRVQELLDARAENRTRKLKHDFAYTGLVHCGHCGCLFVGELKKRKYVYYHCTGNRGKCEEPYTRQEILELAEHAPEAREFFRLEPHGLVYMLSNYPSSAPLPPKPSQEVIAENEDFWSRADAQAIKKLQARYEQIQARIETMYLDKLDGRITQEFFDQQSAAWRSEQDGLQRKIQEVQKATPAPIDQAVDMLRLTSRASELFLQQTAAEQRRLLQVVVEKAAWQDGALRTTLFEPFEILRHSNQESYRKEKENGGSGRDLGIWLPREDSNLLQPFG